ncbi:MAG: amidohydrolase family protein [Dehalococcoidia bacterium]|nr:amidohydrolase family protein [Dehalococcoidia bacterium]
MAVTLVRGRHVVCRVTGRSTAETVDYGAVAVDNGAVVEVGPFDDLRGKYPDAEVLGSNRQAVIPGLINAHHHVGLTPFQLGVLDEPLERWIIARWAIRDVDPYLDTLWCAIQMIESGITTVQHNHMAARLPPGVELYDAASEILNGYEDSGMRVAFSLSTRDQNHLVYEDDARFLSTLPSELAERARAQIAARPVELEEYLSGCGELHARRQGPRTNIFVSPHNVHWCSDEMLVAISDFARRHQTGFHIHLHETIYQRMYGSRHWNGTPLSHLSELGVLGPEVSCAHGVWLSESDIDVLSETNTAICTNPSSNLRLKSGIAPVNRLLESEVMVALGIDEAGMNDDNDILQEMRIAQKIHREPGVDAPYPTSHEILELATTNGAKVTFFDDVGTIEPGKRADLVVLNLDRIEDPYLHPDTDIVDAILYRGKGLDVDTVMVDGEVLLRSGEFVKVDKSEVRARLQESLARELTDREIGRTALSKDLLPYVNRWFSAWEIEEGPQHYTYNLL